MKKSIGTALVVVAFAACSSSHALVPDGGGTGAGGAAPGQTVVTFAQTPNRDVDVVFMLDDSSNMVVYQAKLANVFSSYTDALKALPGGLPNLHLGIVSSSMGAGRNPSIDHCPQGGDQGVFHTKPLGGQPCTRASLNAGQNFIVNDQGMTNYTGELAEMFECLALLGDGGCGFEHQLASVLRALGADGAPAPPQNANFLRPDALLQVILLTDEDDCSAPPDSDLFDSTSMTLTDPLGPLQSYRCNEFGHLCGGKMPPRSPPGEVDLGTCVSNEKGRLLPVADVAAALKSLKADPSKVLVAAIAGPPTPYKVNVGPSQVKGDPSLWPYVEFSCMQTEPDNTTIVGDPGVRLKQWVDIFGGNGLFESVCADFAPALKAFADQLGKALAPPCLAATVDPSTCRLVDHGTNAAGSPTSAPLRQCANSADPGPCWYTESNTTECPMAQSVRFNRPGTSDPAATTTATCAS